MRKAVFFILMAFFGAQTTLAQPCVPVWAERQDSVARCGSIHLVHLHGRPVDRARKMGTLLRQGVLSQDVLRYFNEKVSDVTHRNAGWLASPILVAYHQLVRLFHRASPKELSLEIDAMSEAMGQDPILLKRGLSLPDTGVFLHGLGSYSIFSFLPPVGCTSVAAKNSSGGFSYGRNLDFAGVGSWDRHPMLYVAHPEAGSKELKHLIIGADGLLFGGITGVNEAGITFAVHQNYSRDISLTGVPMVLIGEMVLRYAHDLQEAEEILKKHRPANLWTFVITDLKKGEARAVESSSRHFLTRVWDGNVFAQTNHAMNEKSREWENSSGGFEANSVFRMEQAQKILRESALRGKSELVKALSYQSNASGEMEAYHDILKSETIQTVLFEASPEGDLSLALSAEEAPAPSGQYAEFRLSSLWDGNGSEWIARDFAKLSPEARIRQRTAAMAYRFYFDENKIAEAASLMASQKTLAAFLFRSVAMAEMGRFDDALRLASEALRDPRHIGEPSHIRESLERVRLVSLIKMGKVQEARESAQAWAGQKSLSPLHEMANLLREHRSIPERLMFLHFDFVSGDLSGRKD